MLSNFNCITQSLKEQTLTSIQSLFPRENVAFVVTTLGLSYLVTRAVRFKKQYFLFRRFGKSRTVIVNNVEECVSAVIKLKRKCNNVRVLGMDCEWRADNHGSHRVALLQLATIDGYCSLIRLCNIGHIPDCLAEILYDKTIIKTGVAVTNDAGKLLKDYGVRSCSCLDLRYMAKSAGLTALGLGKMSELYLGVELDKNWRVRCSDWEATNLDENQKAYAAKDALVSVYLFQYLNKLNLKKSNSWWKILFWNEIEYWHNTEYEWTQYLDKGFSEKSYNFQQQMSSASPSRESSITKNGNSGSTVRKPPSNTRSYSMRVSTARKTPLYHNIFIQAPDGMVLCTCDMKKADWYLNKGIASIVCEEPLTLRLKFEPSGRKGGGEGYYAKIKNNICVVCGSNNYMRRKNIVPQEYRKYFPVIVKEHSSHDVLLLCDLCHCRCQYYDQQLRIKLSVECGAPLSTSTENAKAFQVHDLMRVRSAARALLKSSNMIPEKRRKELESILRNYLKSNLSDCDDSANCDLSNVAAVFESDNFTSESETPVIDQATLEHLSEINTSIENDEYQPHGSKVVEYYMSKSDKAEDGVNLLEKVWRNHFVKNMSPKHLPELWSVDYTHIQSE